MGAERGGGLSRASEVSLKEWLRPTRELLNTALDNGERVLGSLLQGLVRPYPISSASTPNREVEAGGLAEERGEKGWMRRLPPAGKSVDDILRGPGENMESSGGDISEP